jgi:hypothetical protein
VLANEVRRGRVDYCGSSRRYVLNGALDPGTVAALRALTLPEPNGSQPTSGERSARLSEPAGVVAASIPDYVCHPTKGRLG